MANELLVGVKIGAVLSGSFQSAFASARSTTLKLGQVADELRVRHSRLGDAMARAMAHPTRNVAELRRQKEELVATIDAIPAMVWSTAEDGRLLYLNRRWTDYDVRTRDGADVWRDIVHPDDIATLEAAWPIVRSPGSVAVSV